MAQSPREFYLLHWTDALTFRRRFTLKSTRSTTEIVDRLRAIAQPPPTDNNPLHAEPTLILSYSEGRYPFELQITRGLPTGGTFVGIFASGTITQLDEQTLISGDIAMTRRSVEVYGAFWAIWLLWGAISWSTAQVSVYVGYLPVWVALTVSAVFGLYIISLQYRDMRRIVRLVYQIR